MKKVNLTDFELEVMQIFWSMGEAIAPDIHKKIAEERKVSYSAVKTIIDRLEEKAAVHRVRTYGRTILYAPSIAKKDMAGTLVRDFLGKMFGGRVRPLMSHLVAKEDLSLDDIAYLEDLIEQRKQEIHDVEDSK